MIGEAPAFWDVSTAWRAHMSRARLLAALLPVLARLGPVVDLLEIFFPLGIETGAVFGVMAGFAVGEDMAILGVFVLGVGGAWAVTHFTADVGQIGRLLHRSITALVPHSNRVARDALRVELVLGVD